jgi:hypothetical protein
MRNGLIFMWRHGLDQREQNLAAAPHRRSRLAEQRVNRTELSFALNNHLLVTPTQYEGGSIL